MNNTEELLLREPVSSAGTHFQGITIYCTPYELIKVCEKNCIDYMEHNYGDDKTNFDFEFETKSGTIFTVYDWKEYKKLNMHENISFHIGAYSIRDAVIGREYLCKELNKINRDVI